MLFEGRDLLRDWKPEERAREGLFLAFQYPVEIPGVSTVNFLKAAVNAMRKHRGEEELDAMEFLGARAGEAEAGRDGRELPAPLGQRGLLRRREEAERDLPDGRARAASWPILDETDSGLDIDALKIVADGVNTLRDGQRAIVVITHYQRLLDYIVPDFVHVLSDGRIVRSGGRELALELEEKGYGWLDGKTGARPHRRLTASGADDERRRRRARDRSSPPSPRWSGTWHGAARPGCATPGAAAVERFARDRASPRPATRSGGHTNVAPDRAARASARAGAERV